MELIAGRLIIRRFDRRPRRDPGPRANRRIRVPEVRVIDENGEQLGIMPTQEALQRAMDAGLDLVEVSPTARPPVCRIMDFGKYKYEQAKKKKASKKAQTASQIKEVKFRPKTEEHDFRFKLKHAEEFLLKHHKVKVTIMFRGREMSYRDRGEKILQRVATELSHVGQIERPPVSEGRTMVMYLAPLPKPVQEKYLRERLAKEQAEGGAAEASERKDGDHAETQDAARGGQAIPQDGVGPDSPQSRVQESHPDEEIEQA